MPNENKMMQPQQAGNIRSSQHSIINSCDPNPASSIAQSFR
jgi:hypothetical protein